MPNVPLPPRNLTIRVDGLRLAGLLFVPAERPRGSLLVCHGAGSCKENHAVMAEQARDAGLAALVFDFRGHGASEGRMDGAGGVRDVLAAASTLQAETDAPWVAGRGSSMGGHLLLRAAAADPSAFRSLVALCPADSASLLRLMAILRRLDAEGDPDIAYYGRFDYAAFSEWLAEAELAEAAAGLSRVLLAHARDDPEVPFASSVRLAAALAEPLRFMALPRGGHRAAQRSADVSAATIEWVLLHGGCG
jgi:pimeloyl-ACP methyl ester carboxylesterase